jgi:Domain of unknown function (DUF4375)
MRPDFKVEPSDLTGFELWQHVIGAIVEELPDPVEPEVRGRINDAQYAAVVLFWVDYEIGNGGLAQLYINSPGVWADEVPELLRQVGAPDHAAAVERANVIVAADGPIPRDTEARRLRMSEVDAARLAPHERAYYAGEELEDVVERFIRSHPSDFFA